MNRETMLFLATLDSLTNEQLREIPNLSECMFLIGQKYCDCELDLEKVLNSFVKEFMENNS